jgi:hypothetical protein
LSGDVLGGWCSPSPLLGWSTPVSDGGFSGGRFWVLQICDEEGEEEISGVSDGERQDSGESASLESPRATPSPITLEAFRHDCIGEGFNK